MKENDPSNQLVREGKRLYCSMMKGDRFSVEEITVQDIQALNFRLASGLSHTHGIREQDIQAFDLFYRAAKVGHPEAQYIVSRCYYWGHGVQKDRALALDWLRKSAESGFAEAQYHLGTCYRDGRDIPQHDVVAQSPFPKERRQELFDLADKLEASGITTPAKIAKYLDGISAHLRKYAQAVWNTMAASGYVESGSADWDAIYGALDKIEPEAFKWFGKAAEQGHAEAQYNLGVCYRAGQGIERDFEHAANWFRKAAEQAYMPKRARILRNR